MFQRIFKKKKIIVTDININKKQDIISLKHIPNNLKVLHSFARYIKTLDKTRNTVDKILNPTETQLNSEYQRM